MANSDENPPAQTSLPESRVTQAGTETEVPQTLQSDVIARSADSLVIPHEVRPSSPRLDPSNQILPQSPTNTSSTRVNSPSSPSFLSPNRHESNPGEGSTELIGREGEEENEEDDDDEDDVGFWGEGISPSTWIMPMGISPMSGWTSPSFFATRMETRNGEANRDGAEDEDVDGDGEWSTDDSEEEETVEFDEDVDVEEIELFGHR